MIQKNPADDLRRQAKALSRFMKVEAPRLIGALMVREVKENFNDESYNGQKWKEVKRREEPALKKGKRGQVLKKQAAYNTTKILYMDGFLKKSIDYEIQKAGEVVLLHTDEDTGTYGKVHNEGLQAGRGIGFNMPKRQFMPIPNQGIPTNWQNQMKAIIKQKTKDILKKYQV